MRFLRRLSRFSLKSLWVWLTIGCVYLALWTLTSTAGLRDVKNTLRPPPGCWLRLSAPAPLVIIASYGPASGDEASGRSVVVWLFKGMIRTKNSPLTE